MSIVTYENVDTPIFDIYYPKYLFASGEDGSLLPDLSAPVGSLFQDAAGTIPVTAYGDYVGLAVDQSQNGRDWFQATNAARMRYGRMPMSGARNRLDWTEDFSNPAWDHRDVDVTQAEAPDGTLTAAKVVVNPSASNEIVGLRQTGALWEGGHRRMQLQAKSAGSRYILWGFYGNSFNYALMQVDLTDGTIVGTRSRGSSYSDSGEPSVTSIGDGWYQLSLGYECAITQRSLLTMVGTDLEWEISPPFENIPGDGVAGILIAHPQTEIVGDDTAEPTPYQRVTERWDITEEGIPDQPILFADLADDAMDIELPAISGGTIVLAGDKGIWISELNFAGGTFTYGPTTYTGGPDSLIENLVGERLIGGFVIDRALTATERAQNIDYYTARGAGQEITP